MTSIRRKPEGDYLLAYCWCGRVTEYILASDVRAGITFRCSKACWTYYQARGVKFPTSPLDELPAHPDRKGDE